MFRYRNNEFSPDTKHTIGVEFATQELEIDGKKIKIQLWDTAGQERYRAITKAYYRGALGAILLYDMTDTATFKNLYNWINEIKSNSSSDIKVMLVGNKKDLVTPEHLAAIKNELPIKYDILTSAKTGEHVEDLFLALGKALITNTVTKI